jgi:hypothetical protein
MGMNADQSRRLRIADGFVVCSFYPLRTHVRTNEWNFAANGCWRERYAGKHKRKNHADKNKNKAVLGMPARRLFFRTLVDVCFLKQ